MKKILLFLFLFSSLVYGQEIKGTITDKTQDQLIGVLIESSHGEKTRSDSEGNFTIKVSTFPVTLTFSYFDYETQSITFKVESKKGIIVEMNSKTQLMDGIVVAASRRSQKIEEVPVSMEIIKPELIENKGLTDLEEAVNLSPGIYTMDGQVSI